MKILLSLLLLSLLLLALAALTLLGPARVVVSDSMAPTYRPGDVLWIRPLSGPLAPGMVVSYDFQGKLVTHRIAAVQDGQLVTRGDNNQEVDPWRVPLSSVVGTPVLRIPYLGYVLFFLKHPAGWLLLVFLPALLIVLGEVRKIVVTLKASKAA